MRYKKENLKKIISFLLVMLMAVASISAVPVKAAENKTSQQKNVFAGKGYEVTFNVTKQSSEGFNAGVTIKNTTDVSIDNWVLAFKMPHKITSIKNGVVKSDLSGNYIIKNTGANQDIAPGKSVSFDFSAACDGKVQIPDTYKILSFEEAAASEKYQINFNVTSDTKNASKGEISIKNLSEEPIEDWKLQFDFDANIEHFFGASILEHTGNHYYIKNVGQNSNIKPGETLVIGFNVNSKAVPGNYILSQTVQNPNVVDSNKDTDKDGFADSLESYYRTNPLISDTDGDGINDYIEIKLNLNPLSKDTDRNGKNDGLEDSDGDGLSNFDEIRLGTDYSKKDTDGDGLLDGQEVNTYHTSPILRDTDKDSINDGDEVTLGLNPLMAYSDGITLDSERKIEQRLNDKKIAGSLKDSTNLFVPSLSGAAAKVLDKEISLDKSDNDALLNNPAVISKPVQVETSIKTADGFKLSFNYSNFLALNDELALNRLVICQYADNRFVPLDTKKDETNKALYANISGKGIYFVLNVEDFLHRLGINPLDKISGSIKSYSLPAIKGSAPDTAAGRAVYSIDKTTGDGTWVLLSNYKYVKLNGAVSKASGIDSDGDGLSDYEELGTEVKEDLTKCIGLMLQAYGVPQYYYSGATSVMAYSYITDPSLPDSDYDGRSDSVDGNPQNNSFSGVLHTAYANSNVSYVMDYRNFFSSNSTYSHNMGTISSLYSSVIYSGNTFGGMGIKAFMEDNGIYDIYDYNLAGMYSDSDISEAYIGHRKVTYNGQTKEIIAIIVRGTNGTIKEWSSNFDLGTTADYYKYADWIVSSNHKGFDVAATRILRCLQQYEGLGYIDKSVSSIYWVTGHSRGAGIANIIGARLINQGKYVYDYTFAAPNTTTAYNASSYTGIYNILNKDDLVPYLPMAVWGFTHYGKSVSISIADNYEVEWENLTGVKNEFGIVDYNIDAIGFDNTIYQLGAIMNTRNDGYIYTCSDHGDGSSDNITITNYGTSYSSREGAIAKIPSNALPHCKITRYNGFLFVGWDFDVCQTPEYFMQVLAAYMAGTISAYRFEVELNIADRYEAAKSAIVRSGLGGIENPHYTESYYLLATHVYSGSF